MEDWLSELCYKLTDILNNPNLTEEDNISYGVTEEEKLKEEWMDGLMDDWLSELFSKLADILNNPNLTEEEKFKVRMGG